LTTSATLGNIAGSVTALPVKGATGPTGAGTVVGASNGVVNVSGGNDAALSGALEPSPLATGF
jgi:hypothetical protein